MGPRITSRRSWQMKKNVPQCRFFCCLGLLSSWGSNPILHSTLCCLTHSWLVCTHHRTTWWQREEQNYSSQLGIQWSSKDIFCASCSTQQVVDVLCCCFSERS